MEQVLAIDPGRDKCGLALVDRQAGVQKKSIVETQHIQTELCTWLAEAAVTMIVIGDGTASKYIKTHLQQLAAAQKFAMVTVDEKHSTEQARTRYWQENPPRGLRRLLPVTLQVPPVPVDDYAAVILAEKYFALTRKG